MIAEAKSWLTFLWNGLRAEPKLYQAFEVDGKRHIVTRIQHQDGEGRVTITLTEYDRFAKDLRIK